MRVLVTGGAGFLGQRLTQALVGNRHEVVILDLHSPQTEVGAVSVIEGDVRDGESVRRAMKGCQAVFHLAAAHHDFGISESTFFSVNELGSAEVCRAMVAEGIESACFYSSVAVFGSAAEPKDESVVPQPQSPYGASKLAGEKVFLDWANGGPRRRALIIRPTVTFGEKNFANMYSLIRQIHRGRYISVGAGSNIKSICYAANLVDATIYLWSRSNGLGCEVFNYVDKPDLTSAEIANQIRGALGLPDSKLRLPLPLALLLAVPFDILSFLTGRNFPVSRARIRKLAVDQTKYEASKVIAAGFHARWSLAEALKRTVQWYMSEGQHQTATPRLAPEAVQRSSG